MAAKSAISSTKRNLSNLVHTTPTSPLACGSSTSTPRKAALLIGCQYRGNDAHGELYSSHGDVQKVNNLLIRVYKYSKKNITMLLDDGKHEKPTRENILKEIEKLVKDAKAGDQLFFHFSGHGAQTECAPNDKTEVDNMDEAIVPCDATDHKDTWIIDNDMNRILVCKIPVGAQLIAVFDMCHSGTALDLKHYCYNKNARQGAIHVCTRTSHDKVDSESRKFTELSGPTETAGIDSKGKAVTKCTRQYSISSYKDTMLCELSESTDSNAIQVPGSGMTSSRADERVEQEVAAVVPERLTRHCPSPSPSCGCAGSFGRENARRYSDIFPWGHGRCRLPTIRLGWVHSLRKKRGPTKSASSWKANETDDAYGPPPRVSTSTSIEPLIPPSPSTQSPLAPVFLVPHPCPPPQRTASFLGPVSLITKIRTEGISSPGVLDSIHEDGEVAQDTTIPDGSDLGILGIPRTMSPDRLTSSDHLGLTRNEASSANDSRIRGSARKVRVCKKTLPAMHKHGQVITIAVAKDDQLAWDTLNGSLTSSLVKILQKDAHPTYKELCNSLQNILNSLSDDLRQTLIRDKNKVRRKVMQDRSKEEETPPCPSVPRSNMTNSLKSGEDVGQDLLNHFREAIPGYDEMNAVVEQAEGGPIQEPVIGTEHLINIEIDKFDP